MFFGSKDVDIRTLCQSCRVGSPSATWVKAFLAIGFLTAVSISSGQMPQQGLEASEDAASIRGTVVNAVTGAPVGRALVYSPDNRFVALTDGEGRFEFSLPKKDSRREESLGLASGPNSRSSFTGADGPVLWARKPGFLDDPRDRARVGTVPGSNSIISLTPEALIKGRVALSTNDPATGVTVQIYSRQVQDGLPSWVLRQSVQTNSAGEFRFAELQAGSYRLLTREFVDDDPVTAGLGRQMYAFPPVYYPNAPDFGSATTIEVAAGQTIEAMLSLTRQPYYDVKIPVNTGEIGGGVNVRVSPQGRGGPGYSLGYNPTESRIEGSLPNGNYIVEGETYGAESAVGVVNIRIAGGPVGGPPMTLVRNAGIRLNIEEEFANSGQVYSGSWSNGKHTFSYSGARAYLQVSAESVDGFDGRRTWALLPPTRPNDDSLVLEGPPPGRYWLRLRSSHGYVAAASTGATDLLHAPFAVAPGSNMTIEIRVRDDGAELEGTVTGLPAQPAREQGLMGGLISPGAWVYCVPLPDSAGQFQQLGAWTGGSFSSRMLAPGDYRVMAFTREQRDLPYRDPEAMRVYESKGQVVHLTAGQKAKVQVQVISSE